MNNYPFGLTKDDLENIHFDYNSTWYPVTEQKLVEQSRWTILYSQVFSNGSDFIRISWREPATEMQEEPFDPYVEIVEPYEVTVTKYRKV